MVSLTINFDNFLSQIIYQEYILWLLHSLDLIQLHKFLENNNMGLSVTVPQSAKKYNNKENSNRSRRGDDKSTPKNYQQANGALEKKFNNASLQKQYSKQRGLNEDRSKGKLTNVTSQKKMKLYNEFDQNSFQDYSLPNAKKQDSKGIKEKQKKSASQLILQEGSMVRIQNHFNKKELLSNKDKPFREKSLLQANQIKQNPGNSIENIDYVNNSKNQYHENNLNLQQYMRSRNGISQRNQKQIKNEFIKQKQKEQKLISNGKNFEIFEEQSNQNLTGKKVQKYNNSLCDSPKQLNTQRNDIKRTLKPSQEKNTLETNGIKPKTANYIKNTDFSNNSNNLKLQQYIKIKNLKTDQNPREIKKETNKQRQIEKIQFQNRKKLQILQEQSKPNQAGMKVQKYNNSLCDSPRQPESQRNDIRLTLQDIIQKSNEGQTYADKSKNKLSSKQVPKPKPSPKFQASAFNQYDWQIPNERATQSTTNLKNKHPPSYDVILSNKFAEGDAHLNEDSPQTSRWRNRRQLMKQLIAGRRESMDQPFNFKFPCGSFSNQSQYQNNQLIAPKLPINLCSNIDY